MKRRIEKTTSRTAEMTCLSRAASTMESKSQYKSDDFIAPLLLPSYIKPLLRISPIRNFITRKIAPIGIYEYVIARTKYIDAVYQRALADHFDQILIFGAGFDTRAIRFQDKTQNTKIYELDVSATQEAKLGQYKKRSLAAPPNVTFIAIDFDKESLPDKLDEAGFQKRQRSLFILEGLLMYLQPESVDATCHTIQEYAGELSRVVFDYVLASVLRGEGAYYGESRISKTVSRVGEEWHFGIEEGEIDTFLAGYGLKLINHSDARDLEETYFKDSEDRIMGNVNGTHCLVTSEKE